MKNDPVIIFRQAKTSILIWMRHSRCFRCFSALTRLGSAAVPVPEFGCVKGAEPYAQRSAETLLFPDLRLSGQGGDGDNLQMHSMAGQSNEASSAAWIDWWTAQNMGVSIFSALVPLSKTLDSSLPRSCQRCLRPPCAHWQLETGISVWRVRLALLNYILWMA